MDVALRRAHAYADAGANGILIHSRRSDANEVLEFAQAWQRRLPVVVVPTRYHGTPTSAYRAAGIATVIWANHNLRASVSAMRRTCARIFASESIADAETDIAPLSDLFELLDYDELSASEDRYLQCDHDH
jgi:phosphoenolpyruvate phosphomutase